ncbi:hypothetical protein [Glutamicibacter sp. AOP5-A2-18]|uniref:hypothetical protein n=1 Tax=Glutamicibacter sp. AOP5-A2-18 TaxID=3457656 RepID=UPI0040336B8A
MGSMRRVWQNWWMQLVGGILMAAIAVLPWLWIGENDRAILPVASDDALGLIIVFALTALLGSWCVRRIGRGRTGFAVVTAVGMFLGMLALGAQGIQATNPAAFSGDLSKASVHQLWVFGSLLVISQAWYFLSAKLRLPVAALFYAMLTVSLGYWLQIVASLIAGAQSYAIYLGYAGALVLGLILGFVGFLRASNLIFWVLSLATQWVMPAVVDSAARVIQSEVGFAKGLRAFGKNFSATVLEVPWQTPLIISLATAMLTSVIIVIVRKARRR